MLQNLKIRYKLLLLLVVPLCGMVMFASWGIRSNYVLSQRMVQTETLTRFAVQVGDLIHEIQKERGYSSGFINTKGAKFGAELNGQREKVNKKLASVKQVFTANVSALAAAGPGFNATGAVLSSLQETRGRIDALQIEGSESFGIYTKLIDAYTRVIAKVATTSDAPEVMREASAYYAFVKAKEEAGKERATLNAVLGAGRFDDETYQRTFDIAGAQKTYLEQFRTFAPDTLLRSYDEKAAHPSFEKTRQIRSAVLAKGVSGGFGITPEEWFASASEKIDVLKEFEDELAKSIIVTAKGEATEARHSLLVALLSTFALCVVTVIVCFLIMRGITNPIAQLLAMLKDIAQGEGDLTRRLTAERRDELGEVSLWFNRFVENVHGIVTLIARSTVEVSSACHQLSSTAEQIATAAEEVAFQSGTAATASEEMSATSNEISRNCGEAASSSKRASDTARGGAAVLHETLQGMEKIATNVRESARTVLNLGTRSDQIGEIVGTIEDIADQTNLLALNAAIEAARAGEQGRGFAVVADEVRALAERTTRATREIAEMIKTIQSETGGAVETMNTGVAEVEKGMESSRKSGEALHRILEVIDEVNREIDLIATAAEEQTAVTGEISTNVHQIKDVVSETARGAHETADAAAHLNRMADDLQKIVARFKL